jgi:two-component system CheB/CheR fusion protein
MEAQLRAVADCSSTMLMICDAEELFTYVNRAYAGHRGRTPEQIVGRSVAEIAGGEAYEKIQPFIRRVLQGEEVRFAMKLPYPNLGLRSVSVVYVPQFDEAGKVTGWLSAVTDFTEPVERTVQQQEAADLSLRLEEQARLFDATLSHISDLAYTFDREARVIYANKALLEIWGRALPEVVGKNLFELDYPHDLAVRLQGELLQVIATGRAVAGETKLRSAAGVEDFHEYIYNPVFGPEGRVVAVAGITRLATERKRGEDAVRRLAAIVESSDDAIVSKDVHGRVTSWNRAAERLFGYTAAEMIGQPILRLIPPGREEEEKEILDRIRSGQPIQHFETLRRRKDGSEVEVSLSVSPVKDLSGNVVGAAKIARDITEKKRTERVLREAKEAAEMASRAKDQFLAMLSHELRTPLTPVLMAVTARLMREDLEPALRADLEMIRRNIELETKLIDDLLDLSRIISGKLTLRLEDGDLNAAVNHACEICRPQIQEKGVRLALDLDPAAGRVRVDFSRLQQVLWNILSNAAKFTPEEGRITVSTRALEGRRACMTITDTGAGIPAEILPKIFDAFEQGGARITRQFGGMGLGLAICKALVELHGGVIRVESKGPGQGSLFCVELPVLSPGPASTGQESDDSSGVAPRRLRILLVEDHADTAMMLKRLLELSGHQVGMAGGVGAALEALERESFDVLVSDLGLPDATGHALMRTVRLRYAIPGIAMSGYGMDEDVRKSRESGFSTHLIKPVDVAALEQAIQLVGREVTGSAGGAIR